MVRYCAVEGCGNVEKGTSKISFFKVPKNQLKKWGDALHQQLKLNQRICEFHFKKSDIVNEDILTLSDGTVFVSKHKKPHLKPGSVPYLSHDQIFEVNLTNHVSNEELNCNVKSENVHIEDHINGEFSNSVYEDSNNSCQICIDDIKNALQQKPLPSNWCWMEEVGKKTILLSYIDHNLNLKCHLRIKNDLTITIINAYTNGCIDLDVKIVEVEMLWEVLDFEKKYLFCYGTGYQDQKYSQNCNGIKMIRRNSSTHRCIECQRLRKKIQNKNNYKKKKKNFKFLYKKTLWQLSLERQRKRCLKGKNEKMNTALYQLIEESADMEESILSITSKDTLK